MTNTITTNLLPNIGGGFYIRYRKLNGGVWSSLDFFASNMYSFTTSDSVGTNYEIEIYNYCDKGVVSSTYTYITNVSCPCNIINLSNLVVGTCDSNTNTFSISLDVEYQCMKNDQGVVTSVIHAEIDGNDYYFNPTLTNGIQNITISNLVADNSSKQITVNCTAA